MHRLLLTVVMVVGALSGFVQGGTVAHFTSPASSAGNQFTAGTVDISSSPASAFLTLADLVPGETVTNPLTVTNGGTLSLRYAVSSSVTDPDGKGLGAQLDLTIKSGVTTCTGSGFGTDGTVLYGPDGPLGSLAGSLDLIGTPSANPNGGRTLTSGQDEALCFQVKLPSGAGTTYQGASTTAIFTFSAQQL